MRMSEAAMAFGALARKEQARAKKRNLAPHWENGRVMVPKCAEERKARVKEIIRRSGPTPPGLTSDHSDLYDEIGLPK